MGNGTVQLLEKLLGVAAGVEETVVLADPSNLGILDDAELLVYRINYSPNVSHCHGSVLIQRELQIGRFLWLNPVNGEAVLWIVTDCGHCCAPSSFSKYEPASRLASDFRGCAAEEEEFRTGDSLLHNSSQTVGALGVQP